MMKTTTSRTISWLTASVVLLSTTAAFAQAAEAPAAAPAPAAEPAPAAPAANERLTGKPKRDARITVTVRDSTAAEAIDTIAEKAGWSLTASGAGLGAKVSLRVKDRPATEVLKTVLDVANLQGRFVEAAGGKGSETALVVADAAATTGEAGASVALPATPGTPAEPVNDEERGERRERRSDNWRDVVEKHQRGEWEDGDRTSVGGDIVIKRGEETQDVVTTGGSITVYGHVDGDAVAIGGSVTIEPGGTVEGDAVAIGGTVDVRPGGTLDGERVSIGGTIGAALSSAMRFGPNKLQHASHAVGDTWDFFDEIWWPIAFLVLGFLTMLFVPNHLVGVRETASARPWASVAAGIGSWFGIFALCVLLAVTIIGIPLVPIAIIGYLVLGLFGLTGLAYWIGSKLTFIPGTGRPLVAFLIGALIIALVGAIPEVGEIAVFLAVTVMGGAALLMLLAGWRRRRATAAPPPPPPAPEMVAT